MERTLPPTINLPVKSEKGADCRGPQIGPLSAPDVKEAESNALALVGTIHHRLMMLCELQEDIYCRMSGHPQPPSDGAKELPHMSLIQHLEQCEVLTHSLVCTMNEVSRRLG